MILPSLWEMGIVMMNQISLNAILMVVTAVQGHDLEATVTTACVMKPSIKQVQYICIIYVVAFQYSNVFVYK